MKKTYSTLLIIYTSFIFSAFVYLLLGWILSRSGWHPLLNTAAANPIFIGLVVILASDIFAMFQVKAALFRQGVSMPLNQEQLHRYIVSRFLILFALSEIPAIAGLVFFLLSGNFGRFIILCGISFVAFAVVKPSLTFLEEFERNRTTKTQS